MVFRMLGQGAAGPDAAGPDAAGPDAAGPDDSQKSMTILEHLEELRLRLIFSLVFLFLGCLAGFFAARPVMRFLVLPFERIDFRREEVPLRIRVGADGSLRLEGQAGKGFFEGVSPSRIEFYREGSVAGAPPDFVWGKDLKKPVFLNPMDPVMLYVKVAFIVGLVFALPLILHQLWLFVAPGLHAHERRAVGPILLLGGVFFPMGGCFAWYMMGVILDFLLNFQIVSMEPFLEITRFVNFELRLMLGFGAVFELPLVVMFLTSIGVLTPDMLRRYRSHAIVTISVLSMMFTPPDPFSMLLMMVPLIILYEVSIWASVILFRRRGRKSSSA